MNFIHAVSAVSLSRSLSRRRTPPWMQQKTSWGSGVKDSKVTCDVKRYPSSHIYSSSRFLNWFWAPSSVKWAILSVSVVRWCHSKGTRNITSTFSISLHCDCEALRFKKEKNILLNDPVQWWSKYFSMLELILSRDICPQSTSWKVNCKAFNKS